jgi:hypothetical protein
MANWYSLWNLGIFYGKLVYFMANWYILWQFGILGPFRYLVVIWYIFPRFFTKNRALRQFIKLVFELMDGMEKFVLRNVASRHFMPM